jgi:predicted porin
MKKALIALAVLGAASGAAMAQSSVTLYGVADVGLGRANAQPLAGGAVDQKKWGAQANTIVTNGTSRIGLTGREDLGGGLWAGFRFEGPVTLGNGASATSDPTAGKPTWNREANLSLGSKDFGIVKLGRSLTPSFNGVGAWELTGQANYSVIDNTYGWGAYNDPRQDAQLDYTTPKFAGISAELAYLPKADGVLAAGYGSTPGSVGTPNKTDRWDFNIISDGTLPGLTLAFTANKNSKTANTYASKANYTFGAKYKVGTMFALAASYNRSNFAPHWNRPVWVANNLGGTDNMGFGKRYGFSLGGSAYLGAFTVTLDLTRDTKNEIGTYVQSSYNGATYSKKYTNGLLEGKYALSKRTFLYADYTRLDGTNNYALGVRHNF